MRRLADESPCDWGGAPSSGLSVKAKQRQKRTARETVLLNMTQTSLFYWLGAIAKYGEFIVTTMIEV